MFYVHVYEPTNEDLVKLDNALFDNKNMLDLEQKYSHKMYPKTAHLIFPSSTPPHPSLYNHIIKDILKFDKNEIRILHLLKYRTFENIKSHLNLMSLEKELRCKDMHMGMYKTLREWMFYVNVYKPTYKDIEKFYNTIFNDMDMIDLKRKNRHKIIPETVPSFATPSTPPPTSPTTNTSSNLHYIRNLDPTSTIFPSSISPTPSLFHSM